MAFSDNPRPLDVQVRVRPLPGDPWSLVATVPPLGMTFTDQPVVAAFQSVFPRAWIESLGGGYLQPGDILMLGDNDATGELVALTSFSNFYQGWFVSRGVYDTVPRYWPAGTRLWKYPDSMNYVLSHEHGPEMLELRALPRTRMGRLPMFRAPRTRFMTYDRSIRPHRPADVKINNFRFINIMLAEPYPDIVVTWARRNRLLEDSRFPPAWDDDDITPEPGQTTHIVLTSISGEVVAVYTNISGNVFTIPMADALSARAFYVNVYAKRDGILSFQAARQYVQLGEVAGWGYDWGFNWGG
jgi:hypothetical protein